MFYFQGDEVNDNSVQPALEVIPPTKKETAWERGLKRAKEVLNYLLQGYVCMKHLSKGNCMSVETYFSTNAEKMKKKIYPALHENRWGIVHISCLLILWNIVWCLLVFTIDFVPA